MLRRAFAVEILLFGGLIVVASQTATAVDTDADGLLDLLDVSGFDSAATGSAYFWV